MNPNVDRLDIGAREESVLRCARFWNSINLGHNSVLSCVAGKYVGPVFEFVLLICPAAQTHGRNDTVSHFTCARIYIHGVERNCRPLVRRKAYELFESAARVRLVGSCFAVLTRDSAISVFGLALSIPSNPSSIRT